MVHLTVICDDSRPHLYVSLAHTKAMESRSHLGNNCYLRLQWHKQIATTRSGGYHLLVGEFFQGFD